ncbi:50S ribosomal protein L3 [Candidatus Lucifugimonas marina]|jgi:large subunit ribosomal protein L3|uniref:Large ribosomal subunit protein uL3 n=1 Tax=Candidatus Lucifugimonas marina TaxID=3038979 RepID=A0AAJ5ZHX0_9CHLR|nr:50S ribosomal protein L3 [SAR202 cluster bacterium JH702]MDG0870085.1 50S ribosomal protein L3 [SAR202 cluster bacterium JH639]WFG36353.1 50S ribosomal protein L3 [SAR202 cluster bacterium JH545]WFG40286.1 50S ribosomal protein L3 [SAR202 cluster bacterium JH1073]
MTIAGLLGRKIGMTTYYHDDGTAESVTAVEVGPCVVTQVKTDARDGYEAVQVGFLAASKLNQAEAGHQTRSGGKFEHLQEFSVADLAEYEVGQELKADVFEVGESIKVTGTSKGKGFAGVVRRWNFRGGPKTHGQSDRHRSPGSIGAGTSPGRVWPGTKMGGHFGVEKKTIKGLRVVAADVDNNVVLVRGSIPGGKNGIVRIERQGK